MWYFSSVTGLQYSVSPLRQTKFPTSKQKIISVCILDLINQCVIYNLFFFIGKSKFPPQIHHTNKASGVNATGMAVFIILLITISGCVYIYNFVDTSGFIGKLIIFKHKKKCDLIANK